MNVTIISDASWCPETGAAGYGYWIACERGKVPGGGPINLKCDGSNSAEAMAITKAIHQGLVAKLIQPGDELLIQTDSLAAIGLFKRTRKGATKQEELALSTMRGLLDGKRIAIKFRHVKGHTAVQDARSITNRRCDERAKTAMRQARAALRGNPFA